MAWPIDARYQTFSAKDQISSAFLNAAQDRTVDLHRSRILPIMIAFCDTYLAGGSDIGPEWEFDDANPQNGWVCMNTGGVLNFPIPIPDGCDLQQVWVKVYSSGSPSMAADLYEVDHKIESATTAPTKGSSLANDSAAGTGAWDTLSLDLTDQEMVDYRMIVCSISAATANDFVAAVYARYEPITPTP
jgi:hypothetical protein